jgi:hypothetical protein
MLATNINEEVLKGISTSRTRRDVKHAMILKKKTRSERYIEHNNVTHSYNHCCHGNTTMSSVHVCANVTANKVINIESVAAEMQN